jgi:translation elongation factor EF-Ts
MITMTGRIEAYLHSDSITPNKGGAMLRVLSQTDFAARTDEFIAFSAKAARFAFAAQADTWNDVVAAFPDLEVERVALAKTLRETIAVEGICLLFV